MPATARVLIATSSRSRAELLTELCSALPRPVDTFVGDEQPKSLAAYRLIICEPGPKLPAPEALFAKARWEAHLVLITTRLDIAEIAQWMRDPRICHFIAAGTVTRNLPPLLDKLESGAIFGLDRYLPDAAEVCYRRVISYDERCELLDQIEDYTRRHRLRGHVRRSASQVAEELLMNAMYQAPMNAEGERVFGKMLPKHRIKSETPRCVSVRYVSASGAFYLSVRDRFGSLRREDLARCLLRCTTEEIQIEEKALGAGLGLYVVASSASHLIVNVMPERITEIVVVLALGSDRNPPLQCLSVTTQRSLAEQTGA